MTKFSNTASVEELQVISRFESLRKILLADQYADHRKKPLAFWALPTDRRLPLAFPGATLGDLLGMPFAELSDTPGIGRKKMCAFREIAGPRGQHRSLGIARRHRHLPTRETGWRATAQLYRSNGFDPAAISEVVWSQWRASVVKHGLGRREAGPLRPQSAEHESRDLEHAAGCLYQLHAGRNPAP